MTTSQRADFIAGVFFILVALLLLFYLIPVGVAEPAKVKFAALNPSYYPKIISYLMLGFGGLIVAAAVMHQSGHSQSSGKDAVSIAQNSTPFRHKIAMLSAMFVILFLYARFLEAVGFVLLSAVVLLFLLVLAGERRMLLIAGIAVLVPTILYFFFTEIANIPIPTGLLQPILIGS